MKYLKLFEDFQIPAGIKIEDFVFDWFPYDAEVDNPKNASMPESLSYSDLKQNSAQLESQGSSNLGLFISHKKSSDGGFVRLLASSLAPLSFDLDIFDKNFEKVSEFKVKAEDLEGTGISDIQSGSSLIRRISGN